MTVCSEAVLRLALDGAPVEQTVRACTDPRMFITVVNVAGGAVWRGHKLGRVARYYWSTDADPILYADGARRVAKTDGARPLPELTDTLPPDIDYARYCAEAKSLAIDLAVVAEPSPLGA